MIDMGYVTGSKAQAEELIVGTDTVYVHADIQKLDETDDNGNPIELYKYHEIQYQKDEYTEFLQKQLDVSKKDNANLWYESMNQSGKLEMNELEISGLWYEIMNMGGE